MGCAAHKMWRHSEVRRAYQRGMALKPDEETQILLKLNFGAFCNDTGDFEQGKKLAEEILEIDPENRKVKGNLGFALLGLGDLRKGFEYYGFIADEIRRADYGAPEWRGEHCENLVVNLEQGVGDSISFAELIPEAAKMVDTLYVHCPPIIAPLMKRSFPEAVIRAAWDRREKLADLRQAPVGQLGEWCSYSGKPFLTPCPVRSDMWERHLASLDKPTWGIAWSGGVHGTAAHLREWVEDEVKILTEAYDVNWVSLQYRGNAYPGIEDYQWCTQSNDYDDAVSLVEGIRRTGGRVLCVQTAIAHVCGALGADCSVFIPSGYLNWRYSEANTPWYDSLKVIRQTGSWKQTLENFVRMDKWREPQMVLNSAC